MLRDEYPVAIELAKNHLRQLSDEQRQLLESRLREYRENARGAMATICDLPASVTDFIRRDGLWGQDTPLLPLIDDFGRGPVVAQALLIDDAEDIVPGAAYRALDLLRVVQVMTGYEQDADAAFEEKRARSSKGGRHRQGRYKPFTRALIQIVELEGQALPLKQLLDRIDRGNYQAEYLDATFGEIHVEFVEIDWDNQEVVFSVPGDDEDQRISFAAIERLLRQPHVKNPK